MMKSFDGNAGDSTIFKERCQAFLSSFKDACFPNFIVIDSKLYHEENRTYLPQLKFIIMGLLMIMTLPLLVYSIAQRHLRKQLLEQNETLPNQIKQPIQNPTMRWIFQLLEGIDVIYVKINGVLYKQITGISDLKEKILYFFSEHILNTYSLNQQIVQKP